MGLLTQGQEKPQFMPENKPEKGEWYWVDVNALAAAHAGGAGTGIQPVLIEALFGG